MYRCADNAQVSLDDALMSALAMFVLKDPSLLELILKAFHLWGERGYQKKEIGEEITGIASFVSYHEASEEPGIHRNLVLSDPSV